MAKSTFKLDLTESFTRLSHPPIVEAVIHWQARSQKSLEPEELRIVLLERMQGFASCEPIQKIDAAATFSERDAPLVQQERSWHGYRLKSKDERYVVQFSRDGVVFSQTKEYQDWQRFVVAAKPAWALFQEIGAPLEIQRLGVRFINHIFPVTPDTLTELLREPPTGPSNLPLSDFFYQSTFSVPNQPFGIRIIKALSSTPTGQPQLSRSGLFIDIDVYSTKPIPCESAELEQVLEKMRWLKNKTFFSLLTEDAIKSFN